MKKRYYLDDLFPHSKTGVAQTPFLYEPEHASLLNFIIEKGTRKKDESGHTYYELEK